MRVACIVLHCNVVYHIGSYCVYASTVSDADKVHCPLNPVPTQHTASQILTPFQNFQLWCLNQFRKYVKQMK